MKIALIDPSLFSLPYDVKLADGLNENGHQVVIFGQNPGRQPGTDDTRYLHRHFYPGFSSNFMRGLPPRLFLTLKGLSHIESMFRLIHRMRTWQPHVIHFQWTPLAVVDKHFVPFFRRIAPTVLTVHDSEPFNNNPRARLQRIDSLDIMRSFDQLIVHTAAARARLIARGLMAKSIKVVPHGLLMNISSNVAKQDDAVTDERVTLLLFGQIKPYKGVDVLLRAIAALPVALREKCRVRIVGKAQMQVGPLVALAEELGLERLVEFDFRFVPENEIQNLMEQADILVFPYREIDASGVLMLAIPAGRVIVASNIGLFRELLEDGRHGALVSPDDPAALADALAPLIADRQRRCSAARSVRELAGTIPAWKDIGRMTEKVYQSEIIERSRMSLNV